MSNDTPRPSQAVSEAARRLRGICFKLEAATADLVSAVDARVAHPDDLCELLTVRRHLVGAASSCAQLAADRALEWFRDNEAGHREVIVGKEKFYGQRVKSIKVVDMPAAARAVAEHTELGEVVPTVCLGDVEAIDLFWRAFEDFFKSAVSTSGLKQGACKKILVGAEERRLLEEGDHTDDEIERARYAAFDRHWKTTWPDSLGKQGAKKVLGVANLRFVHRQDGGLKKDLEALDRRLSERAREKGS